MSEESKTKTATNTIEATEIEKNLDNAEEEEQQDFDNWFNNFVNEEPKNTDTTVTDETNNDKPITDDEVNNDDKPIDEEVNTEKDINKSIDEDKPITEEVNTETNNDDKLIDEEKVIDKPVDEEVNTDKSVDEETNKSADKSIDEETNKSADKSVDEKVIDDKPIDGVELPKPYTLSDVQGKKKVKQDVTITKHRKHRSRKTELTSSLPEKQPITIQENENGKVEIGTKKAEKLSDEELEKKLHKSADKLVSDIQNQVNEMEENGNCRQLDEMDYTPGSDKFNIYKNYLLTPLLVPKRCTTRFNLNEYISSITNFTYNCFDSPNVSMQHPIPEKVIFTERLNKIFDFQFVSAKSGEFHFSDLDTQLLNFIAKYKELDTLTFEYKLIKSMLGKLILCLNTDVELALRDNTKPTLNSAFKQVIIKDIQYMKHLQNTEKKTFLSWKTFLDTLLGVGGDKLIYVHDNYRNLNIKLERAYSTDFLTENLLANTLKCYLPSVALNYFYTVKSIYIIARMVSIYIQLKKFEGKTQKQVMNELYAIATAGIITYENKSFIYKQASRTLPNYDKPLSNETKLYILNHLLTGGQFYILKMLEDSLPVISNDLVTH